MEESVSRIGLVCDGIERYGNRIVFKVKNAILAELVKEKFREDLEILKSLGFLVEFVHPGSLADHFPESFENFFYSKENEFTVVALRSLLSSRVYYRTAVIVADAGMGKTHLLKALANESLKNGKKAVYMTSHRFVEEVFKFYRGSGFEFLKDVEVILIDDIQNIKGRNFALEFLARIMDRVETKDKTLVMASQIPINSFGESPTLKTRLMSCLKVSILPPSYDIRERIFKHFSFKLGVKPPADLVDFVRRNVSNPRAIIGVAKRFKAYYDVYNVYPSTEEFISSINDLVDDVERMLSKGKPGIYFYALNLKNTGKSVKEISEILGVSRATVYNYIKKAKELSKRYSPSR